MAKKKAYKKKANPYYGKSDWAWKPPKPKKPKKKKQSTWRLSSKSEVSSNDFYMSREWRDLRYRVIRNADGCCCACGRSKKDHGIVIHVDHIKPRSKYPALELSYDNMQILCEDCNKGKSNVDETDWRALDKNGEAAILIEANKHI